MLYENIIRDFALRTRENLSIIERLHAEGEKVFETTQLINSMLGLLIFPQQEYVKKIPRTSLDQLRTDGWPIPKVTGGFQQVSDLNQLIRYLRNAIAHFNVVFLTDENEQIIGLRVWNMRPVKNNNNKVIRDANGEVVERKNWEAELSLRDLRQITDKFIDMLVQQ